MIRLLSGEGVLRFEFGMVMMTLLWNLFNMYGKVSMSWIIGIAQNTAPLPPLHFELCEMSRNDAISLVSGLFRQRLPSDSIDCDTGYLDCVSIRYRHLSSKNKANLRAMWVWQTLRVNTLSAGISQPDGQSLRCLCHIDSRISSCPTALSSA
jgi:hypothetical protein